MVYKGAGFFVVLVVFLSILKEKKESQDFWFLSTLAVESGM